MQRIPQVDTDQADQATKELLHTIRGKMGGVPNILATMAQSTAATRAYLGFSEALSGGTLPTRLREQLALAVGEANGCDYCVAAHTALGEGAGLTVQETCDARRATASNEQERVALEFAKKLVLDRGVVSKVDIERLRHVGFNHGQVVEIVANVAMNLFTNYFNHVAGTEIDFPAAPKLAAA